VQGILAECSEVVKNCEKAQLCNPGALQCEPDYVTTTWAASGAADTAVRTVTAVGHCTHDETHKSQLPAWLTIQLPEEPNTPPCLLHQHAQRGSDNRSQGVHLAAAVDCDAQRSPDALAGEHCASPVHTGAATSQLFPQPTQQTEELHWTDPVGDTGASAWYSESQFVATPSHAWVGAAPNAVVVGVDRSSVRLPGVVPSTYSKFVVAESLRVCTGGSTRAHCVDAEDTEGDSARLECTSNASECYR
jgi:hypothetical protein